METKKINNPMRNVKIDKVVLNMGATGAELEKAVKLLEIIMPNRKACKTTSKKRIPALGVRPGLEVGTVVTIRKDIDTLLKRLFVAIENRVRKKQVSENNFSFGIKEYLEIPGMEYNREIGIMGFDVTVVFKRTGRRVSLRKMKRGKIPKRQVITKGEIIKFMEENYNIQFI